MTKEQAMRVAIQSGAEIDDRYLYSITFTEKSFYEFAKALDAGKNFDQDINTAKACETWQTPKYQH